MKKGDKIKIHAYKHDGHLHLISHDTYVLEETDDMIVCANNKALITEGDGRSYKTNETAIIFFYKKNWFNIICQFKKYGVFYYCNIATPCLIDNYIINYIDYDLDLRVFPDGGYKILDKNEYVYHKKKYNYNDQLDRIIKGELAKLIDIKKKNLFPFGENDVNNYLEIFSDLQKKGNIDGKTA